MSLWTGHRQPILIHFIRFTCIDIDITVRIFWMGRLNRNFLVPAVHAADRVGVDRERAPLLSGVHPWSPGDPPRDWVRISIADSGQGIAPDDKEKIFEPFFTTKEGGTGLGLSIVHKIIEGHEGMIKVESEVGRGSTFTLFLPFRHNEERMEC